MIIQHPLWIYDTFPITEISDMPEGTYGFVYEVTHIPTNKKYIGKKNLYFERNKKLGKKALIALKEERKEKGMRGPTPTKIKVITESDWKSYYGSQTEIKKLVEESEPTDFKRVILKYVSNKKLLTYYETKYLFINEVIENPEYLNDNIQGRFFSKDFLEQ